MSAADDYPWLVARGDAELMYVSPPQGRIVLAEIDALRAENARLKVIEAENAEIARLRDQIRNLNEADAALLAHIRNGGRV